MHLGNCAGLPPNDGRQYSLAEKVLMENCKITKKTPKYVNNQQMYFRIYDVFYSQCSHQHASVGTPTIFRVILILPEYSCGEQCHHHSIKLYNYNY
jgi:hypothetical protein